MIKRMIFHAPYASPALAKSGSRVRPKKMREAFRNLGYEVFDLTGTVSERRKKKRHLRQLIRSGVHFDFLYYENSTQPNLFAGRSLKDGIAPFLDHRIHRMCIANDIPVGIFYRDVYWKFRKEMDGPTSFLNRVAEIFQRVDWLIYRRNRVSLFLPSLPMGNYLNLSGFNAVHPLPPGAEVVETPVVSECNLFYVGGIGSHYRFEKLWKAVANTQAKMRVCVPKEAWEISKGEYVPENQKNIEVVHGSGQEITQHWNWAGLGVLALEPQEYRSFAAPIKLFDYLGHGKPVLVSAGTYAAEFISETQAGWVVPYDASAMRDFLNYLARNPTEISEKAALARRVAQNNTWQSRAETVVSVLIGNSQGEQKRH